MEFDREADPVRATFVAILQQLNRTESINEGHQPDQSLHLDDLERVLRKFWAIDEERVKLPLALGLLLRNGMVEIDSTRLSAPAPGQRARPRYRITTQGKQFLVDAISNASRIA